MSEAGIDYVYMGEELGGYRRGGYQTFVTASEFQMGVNRLENITQDRIVAIICADNTLKPDGCYTDNG